MLTGENSMSSPSGGKVLYSTVPGYFFIWLLTNSILLSNSAPRSFPCQSSFPSMISPNPFPFSVLQMMAVGF